MSVCEFHFCASRGRRRSVYSSPGKDPSFVLFRGKSVIQQVNCKTKPNKNSTTIVPMNCLHFCAPINAVYKYLWTVEYQNSGVKQEVSDSVVPLSRGPRLHGWRLKHFLVAILIIILLLKAGVFAFNKNPKIDLSDVPYLHAAATLCARATAGSVSVHLDASTASLKWT